MKHSKENLFGFWIALHSNVAIELPRGGLTGVHTHTYTHKCLCHPFLKISIHAWNYRTTLRKGPLKTPWWLTLEMPCQAVQVSIGAHVVQYIKVSSTQKWSLERVCLIFSTLKKRFLLRSLMSFKTIGQYNGRTWSSQGSLPPSSWWRNTWTAPTDLYMGAFEGGTPLGPRSEKLTNTSPLPSNFGGSWPKNDFSRESKVEILGPLLGNSLSATMLANERAFVRIRPPTRLRTWADYPLRSPHRVTV